MFGMRLRQLRLARGLSIDALAAKMGGLVSKQAISKYERDLARPTPKVLVVLAKALGVKSANLFVEPSVSVDFIAYRKGSGLKEKEQDRVKNLMAETLESWVKLQELTEDDADPTIPVQSKKIRKIEDVEVVASEIRQQWNLGEDPIANVTAVLEDHNVFVVDIATDEKFDGISVVAWGEDHKVRAAAVASRRGIPGERQRLNLVHELGHLVLKVASTVDEECAAFRFGAAFLAPSNVMYVEFGKKRSNINLEELMLFKQKFGLSLQAIVYRLKVLEVINQSSYTEWFQFINKQGWKKHEPSELQPEKPQWLRKKVMRALAEEIITVKEAERLLGEKISVQVDTSLIRRRAFMKLSPQKREQILSEQARRSAPDYEYDEEWIAMPVEDGPD